MSQPSDSALDFSGNRRTDGREDAEERSFDERNCGSLRRSCRIYNSESQFADSPKTSLPDTVQGMSLFGVIDRCRFQFEI